MAEPLLLDVLVREVESLDAAEIDHYAERLAPLTDRLAARPATSARPEAARDRWLTTREAAEYLGLSVHALHRLTAVRAIPFEQEGPRCKCYFKPSALDAWRARGSGARRAPRCVTDPSTLPKRFQATVDATA